MRMLSGLNLVYTAMNNYRVLRKIGVGSYGSAYLVCSKADPQQHFVLKKVQPQDATEREKQQATNEVKVLSKLRHPFVLSHIDDFTYKQQLCIITDYCEQGDLHQYLQDKQQQGQPTIPEAQVLEWFVQMLLALQHVHCKDILHRDLKTQNIFLTKQGYVKLGDFGTSRSLRSSAGMASTCIGTPYYMSPEVLQNLPYDYKSDMWSAGCVLFELLTGQQAFDAPDMPGLMAKILEGAHQTMPQTIPTELQVLIKQLLNSDPTQRPGCEAVLAYPILQPAVAAANSLLESLQATCTMRGAASVSANVSAVWSTGSRQPAAFRADGTPAAAALATKSTQDNSKRSSHSQVLSASNSSRILSADPTHPEKGQTAAFQMQAAVDVSLDEQLQAAQERLRFIQAQREAVREQVLMYQIGIAEQPAGGSTAALHQQVTLDNGITIPSSSVPQNKGSCSQFLQLASAGLQPAGAVPRLPLNVMQQQQQQQQQGSNGVSAGGNSSRSAFAAAGEQRRSVSQSHLDRGCGLSSASALAAAAAAIDDAGSLNSLVTGPTGVHASPRMLQKDPGHPAVSSAVPGSSSSSRRHLGQLLPLPLVGVAASVAAIEQALQSEQANAAILAGIECTGSVQWSLPCLSAPASAATSARTSRQQILLEAAESAAELQHGSISAHGSTALDVKCSSCNTACAVSAPAAADIAARRQHSESARHLPRLPGSFRHSRRSIYDYSGPPDKLAAEGPGAVSNDMLSTQCAASPAGALDGMGMGPGGEHIAARSPELSISPVGCNRCCSDCCLDSSSSCNGSSSVAHVDLIRAKHKASKAEELKRKVAELDQARRSYQLERAAAEVRASNWFAGATACIVPGVTVGSSAGIGASRTLLKHSGASSSQQLPVMGSTSALTGRETASPLLQHSPAAKPPAAGRRSLEQIHAQPSSCSAQSAAAGGIRAASNVGSTTHAPATAPGNASSTAYAGAKGSSTGPLQTWSCAACTSSGSSQTDRESGVGQQQQQHVFDGLLLGVNEHGAVRIYSDKLDCEDGCDEAEIDRQLAALAALRRANRRAAMGAAVNHSNPAKTIVAAASALSPRDLSAGRL